MQRRLAVILIYCLASVTCPWPRLKAGRDLPRPRSSHLKGSDMRMSTPILIIHFSCMLQTFALHRVAAESGTTSNISHYRYCFDYRFFTSIAQPSIFSPFSPTGMSNLTSSIPFTACINSEFVIPPAFARPSGGRSSIGVKNLAILWASSILKWYFSRRTSGRAQ